MKIFQPIVLISGANRGIGYETARQLLQRGCRVIVTSRDSDSGQAATDKLRAAGEAQFHSLDVANPTSVEAIRQFISQEFGRLDVLVNNAAVYLDTSKKVLALPLETLQTTLETNLYGPLRLSQAFLPMMLEHNYGRIVNVSSGMGQMQDMSNYAAAYRLSKLALNGLTRILADAVRGKNVLVNAIDPGWVRTEMGGRNAPRSVDQGAQGIVWAATLPDDGPSGGFFRDGEPLPW
jgi:NAD(P)-dependent dehydrogenase (short-subunit alcohol dehydrogenase family)